MTIFGQHTFQMSTRRFGLPENGPAADPAKLKTVLRHPIQKVYR
jgi:hypothetical protein